MSETLVDRKVYPEGGRIFREGDQGNCAYVVQKGNVEITKETAGGEQVVLGEVGVGGIFGEMALLDDMPRMAAARATEPTVVLVVTRHMFDAKMKKADPFISGLLHIFADHIRTMVK